MAGLSMLRALCWLFVCDFTPFWLGCTSKGLPNVYTREESGFVPVTRLTYDENFAYGCLHEIPIPHFIPDEMFTLEQEKEVLIEIYKKTGGSHWKTNSGWLKKGSNTSHCTWYGVTCHNGTGHVISIFLTNNNLTGTLPASLWKLRNLQGMCMGSNPELGGKIKDFISPNMTNLLRLHLSYNKLSGEIPGEVLVKLKSLVKIQLSGQMGGELRGEIPEDIGNLTELQVLSLGENILTGRIPKSISKLRKLWFLDFETTRGLTGGIENLYQVHSIRFMHLSLSGLGGTLPDEFGVYFPSLMECLLTGNNFTGAIPSSIGEMKNLVHLNLAHNNFSGVIPKSLGMAPLLQIIDLTGNDLTSFEDDFKASSTALEVVLLARNEHLNMKLEDLLDALEYNTTTSLRILNISRCSFHGEISYKLWDFTGFISVDLSQNKLNGSLPLPSDNALFLLHLDFSCNDLHGKIPQQFSKLLALQYLDISDNPRMSCGASRDASPLPNFVEVDFSTLAHKSSSDNFTCPNARLSYNNGLVVLDPEYYKYKLCLCDTGFYGVSGECSKCMRGATCTDHMLPAQHMTINPGYWPSPRADNVTHLVRCSDVMGSGYEDVCTPSKTGCECWIESVTANNKSNLGERVTVCRNSCICKEGSTDRFCSKCLDGYYKESNDCYPCSRDHKADHVFLATSLVLLSLFFLVLLLFKLKRAWKVALLPVQVIILAVLAYCNVIPLWLFEMNTIVLMFGLGGGKTARGLAKISIFYVQTLGFLISTAGDVWPPQVTIAQQYISNVFNLHFSGLVCKLPALFTPVGRLAFVLLVPIACICGTAIFYGFSCIFLKCRGAEQEETRLRLRNACLQIVISSLNLTYFPIVKDTVAVLAPCQQDGPFSYMPLAPWLPCDGHTYIVLINLARVSLVYVLGVPFALFLPLLVCLASKRDQLDEEKVKKMDSWLGSIYIPYKNEFRSYYEVLFLVRRMLLAFSLSFIPSTSSYKSAAVCSVLLAALSFQLFFRPYESSLTCISLENTMETVVLAVLHFSFMNVGFVSLKGTSDTSLIWLLIAVNGAVILGLFISLLIVFGKSYKARVVERPPEDRIVGDDPPQGADDEPRVNIVEEGAPPNERRDVESESSSLLPESRSDNTTYGLC